MRKGALLSFFSSQNITGKPYIDSDYSWFRLCISVLISLVGSAGMWAVVIVLPAVQEEFGIDRSAASLPYTTTMIGFALGNFLLGRMVDRFGITLPMIAAAMMLTAGFTLGALAGNIWLFAAAQGVLIGVGSSITFGPLIADISHWFERHRGVAVAAAASGNYLAGTFWPLILKDVIATDGWRDAYMLVAISSFAIMTPMALLLRRRLPAQVVDLSTGTVVPPVVKRRIDISPRVLQILLCTAGFGVTAGAEMLSIMLAGGIVSRLLSGFLADRIGGVRTILLGSFLQCLALFLYLPFNGLVSLYVVSLIFGLSQGGIVPSYAIVVREYLPAKEAGERVGLVIMMTVMGMALGGWMSGLVYDLTGSYQAAFINGIAWNMLNMGIMALLLWRTRERGTATV